MSSSAGRQHQQHPSLGHLAKARQVQLPYILSFLKVFPLSSLLPPCRHSPGASAVTSTWQWLISSGGQCFIRGRSEWKGLTFHFCCLRRCQPLAEDGTRQVSTPRAQLQSLKVNWAPVHEQCSCGMNTSLGASLLPLGCLITLQGYKRD